jgi:hypothetical protein
MNTWIKCSIEPGMLSGEYAVALNTITGPVSLFAQADKVNTELGLLSVERFGDSGDGLLVRLPSYPFEVSSRNVRVPFETEHCDGNQC